MNTKHCDLDVLNINHIHTRPYWKLMSCIQWRQFLLCSVKVSNGAQLKEDEAVRIQLFEIKFVKLFIYLQEFIWVVDCFSVLNKLHACFKVRKRGLANSQACENGFVRKALSLLEKLFFLSYPLLPFNEAEITHTKKSLLKVWSCKVFTIVWKQERSSSCACQKRKAWVHQGFPSLTVLQQSSNSSKTANLMAWSEMILLK